jgi:hypothetical protein
MHGLNAKFVNQTGHVSSCPEYCSTISPPPGHIDSISWLAKLLESLPPTLSSEFTTAVLVTADIN